MVDYSKTKIYRIPVGDQDYYGHTTQTLCKRRAKHVGDFKSSPNRKVYKAMIELGMTADDITLLWVEDYPCKSKHEAKAREHYWIENFGTLNKNKPYTEAYTEREYMRMYREQNKDYFKAKHHERYEQNKDYFKAYYREYRQTHKDDISVKHREYRETHKDDISAKQRIYREANRDAINAKKREYREAYKDAISAKKREYYQRCKQQKESPDQS